MTGSSGFCVDHWVTVEMNCSNWLQSTFLFPAIPQWDGSQGCVTINAHPSDISECRLDDSVTNYGWVAQKSKRVRSLESQQLLVGSAFSSKLCLRQLQSHKLPI